MHVQISLQLLLFLADNGSWCDDFNEWRLIWLLNH